MNKSKFLNIDESTKIQYWTNFEPVEGEKYQDVIVFNYGLVCNIRHFEYQIDFFHNKGYNILLHDYRGHYESETKEGIETITFENIISDLNTLINHLNIETTIHIGHSMGVNVTIEYAFKYPTEVKKMILISGTIFPPQDVMFDSNLVDISEPYIKEIKDKWENQFKLIWKNAYLNPLAKFMVWRGGFNTKKTNLDFVQYYMKKLGQLSPDIFFQLLDEMREQRVIKDLEQIKTPALIIGGDKDKVIPNYLQQILHKGLANSELYIIKNGSHVPQVDFPEFINERIELFLD
ncbi:Ndr family protein [Halobacteriovorax sp. BALOs_7]|uniref:alpha/beta fold hydrolase n=1 Tax=Halobacteriovorax sp. BALOs_7 TaxID=2109558 RepID=UPI000EB72C51|nr:alpha/beta hydrolase [Halobacteriovorax sp. BALOs_7]AYF43197.1 Ndr family protein [Halobacteriovorax sp. BALOs_7]